MTPTTTFTSDVKIFIVEDDAFMGGLLSKNFEASGAQVFKIDTGKGATEMIKQIMPNVVLLDIMLPDVDGFEILQKLKADTETRNIPIIMLSNLADKVSIEKSKKMGAVSFLIKATMTVSEIAAEIAKQLKIESMTRG